MVIMINILVHLYIIRILLVIILLKPKSILSEMALLKYCRVLCEYCSLFVTELIFVEMNMRMNNLGLTFSIFIYYLMTVSNFVTELVTEFVIYLDGS